MDVDGLNKASPRSANRLIVDFVDDFAVNCAVCFGFSSKAKTLKVQSAMYSQLVIESDHQFVRQ